MITPTPRPENGICLRPEGGPSGRSGGEGLTQHFTRGGQDTPRGLFAERLGSQEEGGNEGEESGRRGTWD